MIKRQTSRIAYDSAGRLAFTRNPDGSATAHAYDALGHPAGTVRVGAGQTLGFDPLGFKGKRGQR